MARLLMDSGDTWTLVDGDQPRFSSLISSGAVLIAASDTDGVFLSADSGRGQRSTKA